MTPIASTPERPRMIAVTQQQSLSRRLSWPVIFSAIALLVPSMTSAEIVIDDFDEPFEIVMPQMNRQTVIQSGVGSLEVERWSQIVATSASRPTGRADSDLSTTSALTVEIDRLNPDPLGGPPAVGINLFYFFDEIDVTQGGMNDRVAIDFVHLRSAALIPSIHVFVQDRSQPGVSYVNSHFDVAPRDEPFRLEFHLDSFGVRGGGFGKIDYRNVYNLSLGINPAHFSGPDEIDFSAVVERIRLTHAVPEPPNTMLMLVAFLAWNCFMARTKEFEPCGKSPF